MIKFDIDCYFSVANVAIGLTRTSFGPSLAPIQSELVFEKKTLRYYSMALRDPVSMTRGGALADYDALRESAAKLKKSLRSLIAADYPDGIGNRLQCRDPEA